ncbi:MULTISPECIES: hypothetical protein [Pseudoalteromonas]|uniref:hypothetical protein n=1 Tax=Pseudoalteromonas TaxID=53246 RepID=UPI0018673F3E|nr:hypothetical protein [Pseudoalteromonas undina]
MSKIDKIKLFNNLSNNLMGVLFKQFPEQGILEQAEFVAGKSPYITPSIYESTLKQLILSGFIAPADQKNAYYLTIKGANTVYTDLVQDPHERLAKQKAK